MLKKLTKEDIEKATIEASKGRSEALKTMSGGRLYDWMRFWRSTIFTPNREKKEANNVETKRRMG